jgi:protein-disulfide isomerase
MSNRARTRERRQEREKQRRRNRQLVVVGAVVAVAVIIAVLFVIANQPIEAVISEETIAMYRDIPQSVNDDGFPVLGNPDAPVQVVEYSSFSCTACGQFYETANARLVERARAGEISLTYVPLYQYGSVPNGEGAARAAVCALEQDAFWAYHGTLFNWQLTYGNQAFGGTRLGTGASNLGLDRAQWDACMGSDRPDEVLVAANAAVTRLVDRLGLSQFGTPTVTVNGAQVPATLNDVMNAIDTALLVAPPPAPAQEDVSAEATAEASE